MMRVSKEYRQFSRLLGLVIATVVIALMTVSCAEKMICPAYQSAFIFDTTALKKKFSYFVNDTPRIQQVSKNKFLLIEPISYRKQMASFRTIEMLPIYPVIPDSLRFQADNILLGDLDIKDSTGQTPLHPGLIGIKFNVEQENYMYYFRKVLVLPDVRAGSSSGATAKKKRKGPIQWVKNLFKRKETPLAETEAAPGDEPEEKQGFFKRVFGKKSEEPELAADPNNEQVDESTDKPGFFQRLKGKRKGEDEAGDTAVTDPPEDPNAPPKLSFFERLKAKFKKKDKSSDQLTPAKKPEQKKDDGF